MQGQYSEIKKPRRFYGAFELLEQARLNANKRIAYVAFAPHHVEAFDAPVQFKTTNAGLVDPQEFDLILVDDMDLIEGCEQLAKERWAKVCQVVAVTEMSAEAA